MVIIHIYRARATFILVYDEQDTDSEKIEIQMRTYQIIITHKNISKALWENDIHNLQNGRKELWQFFIFMGLEPFFYYFMMTKTLHMSNDK